MRLVVDTNILISALCSTQSLPSHLIELWRADKFDLLTSAEQLDELMRVTRYPRIRERLSQALAGAATFVLTGDMRNSLALKIFEGVKIVSVRECLTIQSLPP